MKQQLYQVLIPQALIFFGIDRFFISNINLSGAPIGRVAYILFALFILLVVLVLMNLLNGLAVSDIKIIR